jgi:hypothetical protein
MPNSPNEKVKLVLALVSTNRPVPVGGRFRKGTAMPMEHLAAERGGYFFDPEDPADVELAKECLVQFHKYLKTKTK